MSANKYTQMCVDTLETYVYIHMSIYINMYISIHIYMYILNTHVDIQIYEFT
jgi:hypothetical protein